MDVITCLHLVNNCLPLSTSPAVFDMAHNIHVKTVKRVCENYLHFYKLTIHVRYGCKICPSFSPLIL